MQTEVVLSNGTKVKSNILNGFKVKQSATEVMSQTAPIIYEKIDKDIIILVDGSDSMSENLDAYQSKLDLAWKIFGDELAPNLMGWTYGLIVFQGAWGYNETNWVIMPTVNSTALTTTQKPTALGMTPMFTGLDMAWNWVRSHAKQARFVLLSDGCANDRQPFEILSDVKFNHTDIPIDTVGIGTDTGYASYDRDFLMKLSELTGGKFYEVKNAKMLATSIHELSPKERPLLGIVKQLGCGK